MNYIEKSKNINRVLRTHRIHILFYLYSAKLILEIKGYVLLLPNRVQFRTWKKLQNRVLKKGNITKEFHGLFYTETIRTAVNLGFILINRRSDIGIYENLAKV